MLCVHPFRHHASYDSRLAGLLQHPDHECPDSTRHWVHWVLLWQGMWPRPTSGREESAWLHQGATSPASGSSDSYRSRGDFLNTPDIFPPNYSALKEGKWYDKDPFTDAMSKGLKTNQDATSSSSRQRWWSNGRIPRESEAECVCHHGTCYIDIVTEALQERMKGCWTVAWS